MKYLKINFERDHSSLKECEYTLSIKKLIYELKKYDENQLVCISLDDGEYYSCVLGSRFEDVEVPPDYDEEDLMYKFNNEQQELLKENGYTYTKKWGLVSSKDRIPSFVSFCYDDVRKNFFVLLVNNRICNDDDLKKSQVEYAWKSQLALDLNKLKD